MLGNKKLYRLIEDLLEVEKCNQKDILGIKAMLSMKSVAKQSDIKERYKDYVTPDGLFSSKRVKKGKED